MPAVPGAHGLCCLESIARPLQAEIKDCLSVTHTVAAHLSVKTHTALIARVVKLSAYRVCTLEAVAAAMQCLEPEDSGVPEAMIANMRLKVNAVLRGCCRIESDDMDSVQPTTCTTASCASQP